MWGALSTVKHRLDIAETLVEYTKKSNHVLLNKTIGLYLKKQTNSPSPMSQRDERTWLSPPRKHWPSGITFVLLGITGFGRNSFAQIFSFLFIPIQNMSYYNLTDACKTKVYCVHRI